MLSNKDGLMCDENSLLRRKFARNIQSLYWKEYNRNFIMWLTHCRLNELNHTIYWKSPISILGMSGCGSSIFQEKNSWTICSGDPDQMPHSAASDLGLHCLPDTHLGVSRLQWVNLCPFI